MWNLIEKFIVIIATLQTSLSTNQLELHVYKNKTTCSTKG